MIKFVASFRLALCALVVLAGLAVTFAGAARARCAGSNVLAKLTQSHPDIMQRVRDEAAHIRNTGAVLWRVEKPGLDASHLFGTLHVSDPRVMEMRRPARDALRDARTVALEIADMSPKAMMTAIAKVPQLMVYTDGVRLRDKLSAVEFKKVSKLLSGSGVPAQMAAVIRPWMVNTLLAMPNCEQQRIAGGALVLDQRIARIARERKIPVVGLETIAHQFRSMANIPDADQLAMLRVSLAFAKERENLFETMIQIYLDRDIGMVLTLSRGLAKIAGLKKSGFAAMDRELLRKRNFGMFDVSVPLVEQGKAFVAVGAAHLVGDTGLVALYRKAGFTVTAVK